jgi:hypothetical protein
MPDGFACSWLTTKFLTKANSSLIYQALFSPLLLLPFSSHSCFSCFSFFLKEQYHHHHFSYNDTITKQKGKKKKKKKKEKRTPVCPVQLSLKHEIPGVITEAKIDKESTMKAQLFFFKQSSLK